MEAAQRTTLEARGGGTHVALLGTQVVAVAAAGLQRRATQPPERL